MTITFIIVILLYLFLIGSFVLGFDKIKVFRLDDCTPKTKFTVVIPFRNEAEHLPELLDSILKLNYPKDLFEIIFVDDASEDDSVAQIMKFLTSIQNDSKLLNNVRVSHSPKKDAITLAIQHAKSKWIITTDADCVLPKYWLDSYDEFIQKNSVKLIAGPVTYSHNKGILNAFQSLDFFSLIGATIGGFGLNKPFLCNGANLAYQKDFFESVNGFEGNTTIASGDDIFLLEKALKRDKNAIQYLKCEQAVVTTKPQDSLKLLLAQRLRWASKTSNYSNNFAKLVGLAVLLANALIIIGFVFVLMGLLKAKAFAYLFFIKIAIDFLLIYKTSQFFNKENLLKHYTWSCLLYPFFSVYIAFISVFMTYKWKGRTFKK
ncbi:glycosyltransferase family 2 protein [Olleya aquimaris]|uniref:Cellulose synthase/poly-beta-1,6-N-acetylglucosamine synthase-like glycosyltransferase n=1 Tax=Olleya aquimaris TaxID=639310 RepID=A0A327RX42_9FLAO|nr:glycosyltransferase [Olleya aquimaris]RAJ18157.1 cellulose synthase/poly-beta-1,6-N-acetylglucosamine synthase-like glycosyltransferase [Olleya aquimaris]